MKRNPWLIALWLVTAGALGGTAAAVTALLDALPQVEDQASYAQVAWEWVGLLQLLLLPATAALLIGGMLALLVFYAARWQRREHPRPEGREA